MILSFEWTEWQEVKCDWLIAKNLGIDPFCETPSISPHFRCVNEALMD